MPASYAGLKDLFDECSRFTEAHDVPGAVRHDVYVAVEELVSNVIRHGGRSGLRPRITVSLTITRHGLAVTVADNAPAFNPLTIPRPDVTAPLLEREVGGLGIHFVKSLMDRVLYRRQRGRNHVRLVRIYRPGPGVRGADTPS